MRTPLLFWDVDTQFDFMDPRGALYVPGAESVVDNLERLTDLARRLEIPVVASADDHELTDAEIDADAPDGATTFPPHCLRGTPGADRVGATRLDYTLVLDGAERSPEDIRAGLDQPWPRVLIRKKHLDVFSNPNTDAVLAALDPERIVVYGVALDFCNRKAIEGLLARGRRVVALTDATKAIDPARGNELLDEWRARGVETITTAELAGQLEQAARSASAANAIA